MTNKEIQKILEQQEFATHIDNDLVIAGKLVDIDSHTGIRSLSFAFSVRIQNNNAIISYGQAQIEKERRFDNIEALLNFILTNYPFVQTP